MDPDIFIPAGRYNFFSFSGNLNFSIANRIYPKLKFESGSYYDGIRFSASVSPTWNPGESVIIEPSYTVDKVQFKNRDQRYTNNIIGVRGTFMFTTKLTFTTFIQFNTFSDRIVTNARIRYNAKEGNDFYIVYNVMVIFAWIFTYVYVLTSGGPINATTILELRIFNLAFKEHNMGMASALAILLFLMIFIFVYLQFRLRQETLEES